VFERLGLKTTEGAGGVGIGGPPSGLGGQVTLLVSHLMNPPFHALAESYEGAWVQGGAMVVVSWCREEKGPLLEEGLSHPFLQGGVGVVH